MALTKDIIRLILRRGTRTEVLTDGGANAITRYAGEPYYDTTDGHLWLGNGTGQIKIDTRAIVAFENEPIFFNNEVVLY